MLFFFLVLLAWFFVTSLELLQSFGIFFLAKCRGRLIHRYSRTCNFLAKKQGVDLYTGSTYTPENTVIWSAFDSEQAPKILT